MITQPDLKYVVKCRVCNEGHGIYVYRADWLDYQRGEHVQNAFPYLSPANRELLISGTCGKCFDEMFPPELDIEANLL